MRTEQLRGALAGGVLAARMRQGAARPTALALLVAGALAVMAVPQAVQAQQATVAFDIAAQPLVAALGAFGQQARLQVLFDEAEVAGRTARAVNGSFTPRQALEQLLAGTGVEIASARAGGFTLKGAAAPAAGATSLAPVTVTAQAERSATTEGTGSYATRGPSSTATQLGLSLRETPQSVSVMTRQRIEDEGLLGVKEVLQQTPGLVLQELGPDRYGVSSRGYGITNYQVDGVSTHSDITTQNISQSIADLLVYDRVEVLRGASGLLTGSGDPSGVINLVRKKPTAEFQGHVGATVGSWNQRRAEADVSGPLNAAGTLRGRLVGALEHKDSHIDYRRTEKQVLYGVLEADLGRDTRLTAGLDHQTHDTDGASGGVGLPLFWSDGEQAAFSRSRSMSSRDAISDFRTTNAFVALEQRLPADWKFKLAANFLRGVRDTRTFDLASWSAFPDRLTGDGLAFDIASGHSVQTQKNLDAHVQGSFELFGRKHEAVFGVNYLNYKNLSDLSTDTSALNGTAASIYTWDNTGHGSSPVKASDSDTQLRQVGAYAAGRFAVTERLKVLAGFNASSYRGSYVLDSPYWGFYSATRSSEHGVVTPYAGLTFEIAPAHTLYASYATIYKPQTVQDRNGQQLDPREGANLEAGIKSEWLGGRLSSNVALYRIRQDNLAVVDAGYTIPGTSFSAYRGIDGARTTGLDLEVNGEIAHGWQIAASYTYGRTEDNTGTRINAESVPEHLVKLWSTYRLSGAWSGLTLGGGVNWQSRLSLTASPWWVERSSITARQGAYAVANLMARYEFSRQLSATLNVNNLFDKSYLSSIDSTFYTGTYGTPRNLQLNLKYRF